MIDKKTFNAIRQIIYDKAGITLSDAKVSLVTARLGKRLRALALPDAKAYLNFLNADQTGQELVQLLDAISTNVTHFFREPAHFDILKENLQQWFGQGQNRLRIWSAASSTGEEPYTIAMTVCEAIEATRAHTDAKILATDISTRVLEICKQGEYAIAKLKDVDARYRNRYFNRIKRDNQQFYVVKPDLRAMLSFVRLNLSAPPFPMKGPLDVVFCRNVMIYFDNTVRNRLLGEIARLLKPGGLLFVGHAESLTGLLSNFQRVDSSVYRKAA